MPVPGFNISWFSSGVIEMEGIYLFLLEPGNYTVVETDPENYTSTTPNSVDVEVTNVDFMDVMNLPNATFGDVKEYTSLWVAKQVYGPMLPEVITSSVNPFMFPFTTGNPFGNLFSNIFGNFFGSIFGGFFGGSSGPSVDPFAPSWRDFIITIDNETVEFRFVVANNGTTRLSNITMYDDTFGVLTLPLTTLEPGEETILYLNATAEVGLHENIVTVNATYLGSTISVWENASYLGLGSVPMNVSFSKQVSTSPDGPWSEHVNVTAGEDTVYFNVTIVNTSNETIENLMLIDIMVGELTLPQSNLTSGEKLEVIYNVTANIGFVENIAVAQASLESDFGYGIGLEPIMMTMDNASYRGEVPLISISIDKKVGPASHGPWLEHVNKIEGTTLYYNVTISNTGEGTLSDVDVIDSEEGSLWSGADLAAGESMSTTYNATVLLGEHNNTVEAHGTWSLTSLEVYDEDNATYTGLDIPTVSMTVEKKVSNSSTGPWYDDVELMAGEDLVWYNVTVNNTGAVTLSDIEVWDDYPFLRQIATPNTTLAAGESMSATYWYYAEYGTLINTVEADGAWDDELTIYVDNSSSATYTGVWPDVGVSVVKKVSNSSTGPWYDYVDVAAGEDWVYFNVNVTNIGDVTLEDIEVWDDSAWGPGWTHISMPSTLAPGASMNATYSHPAYLPPPGDDEIWNAVEVRGYWYSTNLPYEEYFFEVDFASYTGVMPSASISVEKQVSNVSASGPWSEHVEVVAGEDLVYYNVTVTNTGELPLRSTDVIDHYDSYAIEEYLGINIDLSPGETVSYLYNRPADLGENINDVYTIGQWYTTYHGYNDEADDSDMAEYTGVYPYVDVTVEKQVSNISDTGPWYEHVEVTAGEDTVYFNITVINTGDIRLINVTVDDPEMGTIVLPPLNPGEYRNLTYSVYAEEGLQENTVDITGVWESQYDGVHGPYSLTGDDSDTASYTGALPEVSIMVEKKVSNVSDSGPWVEHVDVIAGEEWVHFNVTVTNTGALTLDDIYVADKYGILTLPVTTLLPGESAWANYSIPAEEGFISNHATALGKYNTTYHGYSVAALYLDTANYTGHDPFVDVSIEKKVSNSSTGPWVEHVDVIAGEEWVSFNLTVTNTGAVTLNDIAIRDTQNPSSPDPLTWITSLLPGESAWVNYSVPAQEGFQTNIAQTGGTYYTTYYGYPVDFDDYDTANYTGLYSSIKVDKLVYGLDGYWHDDAFVLVDEVVWYKFKVKNSGSLNLTGISVVDDVLGAITMPKTALAVSESMTSANVSGLELAQLGYHDNTVNATASWDEMEVFYLDTASYTGVGYATISGTVYNDANATEVQETGETGLSGVTVTLYNGTTPFASDSTASDGSYSFLILETGDYRVVETDPSGWYSTTPNEVNVTVSALLKQDVEVDFGDIQESERLIWDQWTCSGGGNYMSPILTDARQYRIEVSNQFIYNTTLDGRADAKYYSPDTWTNYYPAPDGHSLMQIDGGDIDWGAYNSGHVYSILFEGTGASLRFQIVDWVDSTSGNNGGSLRIRIYRVFS
jgi:hypothetical protein